MNSLPRLVDTVEARKRKGRAYLYQNVRFDDFISDFKEQRPLKTLAMRALSKLYTPASIPCEGQPELKHPFHDRDIVVAACGRICMARKEINISTYSLV